MPVPDLEELFGPPIPRNDEKLHMLRSFTAKLCNHDRPVFPGSQPVSFTKADIQKLESREYWVCEKSDGVRVLMLIVRIDDGHEVWLIDRRNEYRVAPGFYFPHPADKTKPLGNSLFDGELLIDVNRTTGKPTTRLLVFDCLVCDDQNVMRKPLESRYGRLQESFLKPFERMLRELPHMAEGQAFKLGVKRMELSYGLDKVLKDYIPSLEHGSDGLIFTCVDMPYSVGTDETLLKWKPPHENSIDFKIELRFPLAQSGKYAGGPDYSAKPLYLLYAWTGGQDYEYHDIVDLTDEEWEKMKESEIQYDDRIGEFNWNGERHTWQFMRFRDDKPNANHISIIEKIIVSILDGVEEDELLSHLPQIRQASKTLRERRIKNAATSSRGGPPRPTNGHRPPPPPRQRPPPPVRVAPKQPYHVGGRFSKISGPPQILGWQR